MTESTRAAADGRKAGQQLEARTTHGEATSAFEQLLSGPGKFFDYDEPEEERLWKWAQRVCRGGFNPKGMSAEACFCAALFGRELGLPPFQAIQNISSINGRPQIWGDAALAVVIRSGRLEGNQVTEELRGGASEDDWVAVCTAKRRGSPDPIVRTFSVKQAKKAKLWGKEGPWQTYPRRMLQMRARSLALRDGFPDVLKGVSIAEEFIGVEETVKASGATTLDPLAAFPAEEKPEEEKKPEEKKPEEKKPEEKKPEEKKPEENKPRARRRRRPKAEEKQPDPPKALASRDEVLARFDELTRDERVPAELRASMTSDVDALSPFTPQQLLLDAISEMESAILVAERKAAEGHDLAGGPELTQDELEGAKRIELVSSINELLSDTRIPREDRVATRNRYKNLEDLPLEELTKLYKQLATWL